MDKIKISTFNNKINVQSSFMNNSSNSSTSINNIKNDEIETVDMNSSNENEKTSGTSNVPKYVNGVDVSSWQQEVDYEILKKYVKFVMIRISNGDEFDEYFNRNFKGATDAGIPTGIYYASNAITVGDFHNEAEYMIKLLSKYPKNKTTFPIFLDFENKRKYLENENTREQINNGIREYLKTMEQAGYPAGLYIHSAVIKYVDEDIKKNYPIWLIDGKDYNDEIDIIKIDGNNVDKKYVDQLGKDTFMVQVSQGGQGEQVGIKNAGSVDVDFMNGDTYKKWIDNHNNKIQVDNMVDGHTIYK